jgi:putative copper export protein
MEAQQALIEWPHVAAELLEFLGAFLAAGAIGFRWIVVPGARRRGLGGDMAASMLIPAAVIGLAGALIELWHLAGGLTGMAERQNVEVATLIQTNAQAMTWTALASMATVGFVLALARVPAGWVLAAIGVIAGWLRAGWFGQWERLIKPAHLLAASLWIGTLFVLIAVGTAVALSSRYPADRRGPAVAALVHAFSPLALVMGGALALLGLSLVWRELPSLDALWTTPYGRTLMVKLAFVAMVFGFGARNFRHVKPQLGSESAAHGLRRSAGFELGLALVVLVVTAVLAGMPSPRP